jgi:hypothetical protein
MAATPSTPPGSGAGDLALGAVVRLLRKPYFGLWGEVVDVPVKAEQLETEAWVRVVHVRLQDGRTISVPQENVEVF